MVEVVVLVIEPGGPDFAIDDDFYDGHGDSSSGADTGLYWGTARFRCLHIEPPGQVRAPVHGVQRP
jgi:hypothetical protein